VANSYDPKSGTGAIGVEFAGTAVTSGATFDINQQPIRDARSRNLVTFNDDLQWQEQFWRGCFTLTIDSKNMVATYYGMRNVSEYYFLWYTSPERSVNAYILVKALRT
jgi:alkaline phosphatase D